MFLGRVEFETCLFTDERTCLFIESTFFEYRRGYPADILLFTYAKGFSYDHSKRY